MSDRPLYPVVLRVEGRPCLVVGGGPVAARKVGELLRCGAQVTVVAPHVVDPLAALAASGGAGAGTLSWERRPYEPGEAAAYRLVVTATGEPAVDRLVAGDAEAAGIWVNSADDPERCTFLLPSVHRDGPVSVAVSTAGASPALAVWLRRRVAEALGADVGALAVLLEEGRDQLRAAGSPTDAVDWAALLDGGLAALVAAGRLEDARLLVRRAVQGTRDGGPGSP